jgi:hypothetical protein
VLQTRLEKMPTSKSKPAPKAGSAKAGRKPSLVKRSSRINLNLTEAEEQIVERAAALDHDNPTNWSRRMVLLAADARLASPRPSDGTGK